MKMDDDAARLAEALCQSLPPGTLQRLAFELLRLIASKANPGDVERALLSILGRKEAT